MPSKPTTFSRDRHTYRSWIDSVGTALAVQQKLMRHSDIRTTMNVYGDVVDDRTKEAHGKVAALVFGDRSPRKHVAEEQDSKAVV
jgi:integrase